MMNRVFHTNLLLYIVPILLILSGCKEIQHEDVQQKPIFTESLLINDSFSVKKVRGQVLYLPIYSNIPYSEKDKLFNLSAFITIHNTDLHYPLKLSKVIYYNTTGQMVSDYLKKDTLLNPLAAISFAVPEADKSGIGANFLVEWVSDSLINEPLIESVMLGLRSGQGISFLSAGKVIREIK